jgi:hypothetical protein
MFKRLRGIYREGSDVTRRGITEVLKAADIGDVTFTDEAGRVLFKGMDIMSLDLSQDYQAITAKLDATLLTVNKEFAKAYGRKEGLMEKLTGADVAQLITADNAPYVYSMLEAYSQGDMKKFKTIGETAIKMGQFSAGSLSDFSILLKDAARRDKKFIDRTLNSLAGVILDSTNMVTGEAIKNFVGTKQAALGTEATKAVSSYMEDILSGKDTAGSMVGLSKFAADNYSGIKDAATREWLSQATTANEVLSLAGGGTVKDAREFISKLNNITADTKNLMLNTLGDDDTKTLGDKEISSLKSNIAQRLLTSHMTSMQEATAQSMQARQNEVLGQLSTVLDRLVTYLNAKDPMPAGAGGAAGVQKPALDPSKPTDETIRD